MDDTVNRLAKELAEAIAAAVAADPAVEACHTRARAAGYEVRVSLEASIGFGKLKARTGKAASKAQARRTNDFTFSANDRRFLRSLRIAPDEFAEEREQ
jgi:hypothetical protein